MESLVEKLKKANEAYRNGRPLLMTDDEYDAALEQLSKLNPEHPFLKKVRDVPESASGRTVQMPYYLGSLDKAKVHDELMKWVTKAVRVKATPFVISEKLDGISGLWNPSANYLYLSGDDNTGLDVSSWLKHISLSPRAPGPNGIPEGVWIRGELIMPKSQIPQGKLGRSIVNGQFHLKTPNPIESAKVRFVGYEIIGMAEELTVQQQFSWLEYWNLWTPWCVMMTDLTNTNNLSSLLMIRRTDSEYEMDGLVIKLNTPLARVLKGNPKDAIAWKPPNGETRLSKVLMVEWNASATGKLVPRVQIEPVHIGGSTIQYVTGVNARRVVDWKIGPGASVIIRKGGDVIPLIESVETPAPVSYPLDGTWEWDGPAETAVNIKQKTADSSTYVSQFMKIVKHLNWPNVGPAVMKSVVEAGYTNVPLLRKASEESLKKLLGPVKGANLFTMVQKDGWVNASEIDLFVASPLRPDGIGKTRLEGLMAVEPDVTRWKSELTVPKGWSEESLKEFQEVWSKYEEFRKGDWSFISYPKRATEGSGTSHTFTDEPMIYKGSIVFSGVRDETLQKSLEKRGYKISDSVKSDTKALIIADSEDPQLYKSGKAEKAKKIPGCLILRKIDSGKL
jgi:NAD-dependent DNA ligase